MLSLIELLKDMRSTSQFRIDFVEEAKVLRSQHLQVKTVFIDPLSLTVSSFAFLYRKLGIVISFFLEKVDNVVLVLTSHVVRELEEENNMLKLKVSVVVFLISWTTW